MCFAHYRLWWTSFFKTFIIFGFFFSQNSYLTYIFRHYCKFLINLSFFIKKNVSKLHRKSDFGQFFGAKRRRHHIGDFWREKSSPPQFSWKCPHPQTKNHEYSWQLILFFFKPWKIGHFFGKQIINKYDDLMVFF